MSISSFGSSLSQGFNLLVSQGAVAGNSFTTKFGINRDTGGTMDDVWSHSSTMTYLTTAETHLVTSDSVLDTLLGTGAQVVHITGLNNSYELITEVLNLNGLTGTTTTNSYIRIFDVIVIAAGSTFCNQGNISFVSTTSANLSAYIQADDNQTQQLQYTIPDSKTGYFYGGQWFVSNGKETKFDLQIRTFGSIWRTVTTVLTDISDNLTYAFPVSIPAKTDLRIRAKATTGTHEVSALWSMLLVDDGY